MQNMRQIAFSGFRPRFLPVSTLLQLIRPLRLLVLLCERFLLVCVKSLDLSLAEPASGDLLREEDVELLECAILGLRESEERPGTNSKGGGAPDET